VQTPILKNAAYFTYQQRTLIERVEPQPVNRKVAVIQQPTSTKYGERMRKFGLTLLAAVLAMLLASASLSAEEGEVIVQTNANSRETYFTMHNIGQAHAYSKGKGVKIGVIDGRFGTDEHPSLYAGAMNFRGEDGEKYLHKVNEHGYWMSVTLREIAPEAEIYALNIVGISVGPLGQTQKIEAMIQAIDWAIAHKLDALTYSGPPFAPEQRKRLDDAVERAHKAGIVTTFIHYPHPNNLLPGWLGPKTNGDGREPDISILQYDYNVVFPQEVEERMRKEEPGYAPFFSNSSTSPVVAGVVALLRSLKPDLTPEQCRQILMETAHPLEFEGRKAPRAMDAAAAVARVRLMIQSQSH
jgi:subtilisin family serine protease